MSGLVARPKYRPLLEHESIHQVRQLQPEYFWIEELVRFHLCIFENGLKLQRFEVNQVLPNARARTNVFRNVQQCLLLPWQEFHIAHITKFHCPHLVEDLGV